MTDQLIDYIDWPTIDWLTIEWLTIDWLTDNWLTDWVLIDWLLTDWLLTDWPLSIWTISTLIDQYWPWLTNIDPNRLKLTMTDYDWSRNEAREKVNKAVRQHWLWGIKLKSPCKALPSSWRDKPVRSTGDKLKRQQASAKHWRQEEAITRQCEALVPEDEITSQCEATVRSTGFKNKR